MAEFLEWHAKPATVQLYKTAEKSVQEFVRTTNEAFIENDLPMRVDSLTTVSLRKKRHVWPHMSLGWFRRYFSVDEIEMQL
jgi:hypothetical protein